MDKPFVEYKTALKGLQEKQAEVVKAITGAEMMLLSGEVSRNTQNHLRNELDALKDRKASIECDIEINQRWIARLEWERL